MVLSQIRRERQRAHRAAYIAVMERSLARSGSKRELASRLDITPQHLSCLLTIDDGSGAGEVRSPSPTLAVRIAEALPLTPVERASLITHMLAARSSGEPPRLVQEAPVARFFDLAPILEDLRSRLWASPHADEVRHLVDTVLELGEVGFSELAPIEHAIPRARLGLCLADGLALRNNHSMALYHAHLAQAQIEHHCPTKRPSDGRTIDALRMKTAAMLARIYLEMGQPRRALEHCETVLGRGASPSIDGLAWSHLKVLEAAALIGIPRTAIRSVEQILEHVSIQLDEEALTIDRLACLIQQRRAELYASRGKPDHADLAYREALEMGRDPRRLGVIGYVDLVRSYTRFCRDARRDPDYVHRMVMHARGLARKASLTHLLLSLASEDRIEGTQEERSLVPALSSEGEML